MKQREAGLASATALQNLGIGSWPRRRATLSPNRIAIEFEGQKLSFTEFDALVDATAVWLAQRGIRPGDRVGYWGANHVTLLTTLFASTRIGAICVLFNARLSNAEAAYILQDSGARALFFGSGQAEGIDELRRAAPGVELVDVDGTGKATSLSLPPVGKKIPEALCQFDDPAVIMYTSGTTGSPKGAVLSHGNLFFNDVNVLIENDVRNDEVCLAAAPLFHIAGLNGLVLPSFLKGGKVIIHRGFEPGDVLTSIEQQRITSFFAVPAMLDAIASHQGFADTDLSSLRTIVVGGAPVPERTLRVWAERDVAVQQGYGLTETAPAVLKLSADDGITKAGSAGNPQFLVDVRLRTLAGNGPEQGEVGEIQVIGPNVFKEYWGREDDTVSAFSDGWFRTGDAAEQDSDGYYWVRDRYKDMYISGGENVYPAEVESALCDIDGVAEAAVIGVPDERWGEVGKAFIRKEAHSVLTADEIARELETRISRFKLPKFVEFLESMPRTSTGKLMKQELRSRKDNSD